MGRALVAVPDLESEPEVVPSGVGPEGAAPGSDAGCATVGGDARTAGEGDVGDGDAGDGPGPDPGVPTLGDVAVFVQRDLGWEELWAEAQRLGPDPVFADRDDEAVVAELRGRAVEVTAAMCRLVELVAEFTVRGIWAAQGAATPAVWLAWQLGIGSSTAREYVRVGLRLRELPAVRERFAAGRLSYSKVRAITRGCVPEQQDTWLYYADNATASELERISAGLRTAQRGRVEAVLEPDRPVRSVRVRPLGGGRSALVLEGPSEEVEELRHRLERFALDLRRADTDAAAEAADPETCTASASPSASAGTAGTNVPAVTSGGGASAVAADVHGDLFAAAGDVSASVGAIGAGGCASAETADSSTSASAGAAGRGASAETADVHGDLVAAAGDVSASVGAIGAGGCASAETADGSTSAGAAGRGASAETPDVHSDTSATTGDANASAEAVDGDAGASAVAADVDGDTSMAAGDAGASAEAAGPGGCAPSEGGVREVSFVPQGPELADAAFEALLAGTAGLSVDTSGLDRHTLVLHAPATALAGGDGPHAVPVTDAHRRIRSLSASALRRLACQAALVTVVTDDQGEPLDVGRRHRSLTSAIRRALVLRDRSCRYPGCDRTRGLHGHHIWFWSEGGPTKLSNLILLCAHHHGEVHRIAHRIELRPGGDHLVVRDGQTLPRIEPAVSAATPLVPIAATAEGVG
jgi:hypothetical protein